MKKFLMGGVSLFAILSANNAMAAGYTCEELIEYTSCMPGYYLSDGAPSCPDGYTRTSACLVSDDGGIYELGWTKAQCIEDCIASVGDESDPEGSGCGESGGYNYEYHEYACILPDDEEVEIQFPDTSSVSSSCNECPAGSICAGGTVAAAPCPAGSYCATTKLKEPTGLCALNSYSTGGATTCSACPATELTDKDGKTVVAKTAGQGSTSASACFIDPNAYFKNTKGIYHFKSNCAFDPASQPSCEYFEMFIGNNPSEYICKEDLGYVEDDEEQMHHTCDGGDSDCIKNHIQNCSLYRSAAETEECDADGCTVDLGNGITCRY